MSGREPKVIDLGEQRREDGSVKSYKFKTTLYDEATDLEPSLKYYDLMVEVGPAHIKISLPNQYPTDVPEPAIYVDLFNGGFMTYVYEDDASEDDDPRVIAIKDYLRPELEPSNGVTGAMAQAYKFAAEDAQRFFEEDYLLNHIHVPINKIDTLEALHAAYALYSDWVKQEGMEADILSALEFLGGLVVFRRIDIDANIDFHEFVKQYEFGETETDNKVD